MSEEMPEWLEKELDDLIMEDCEQEYELINRGIDIGFHKCFELMNERMKLKETDSNLMNSRREMRKEIDRYKKALEKCKDQRDMKTWIFCGRSSISLGKTWGIRNKYDEEIQAILEGE